MNAMTRFLGPVDSLDSLVDDASWRQRLVAVVKDIGEASSSMEGNSGLFDNAAFASGLFVIAADGPARSYLAAQGIDPSGMSPSKAILLAFDLELRSVRDQHYKWTLLPRSVRGDRFQAAGPPLNDLISSQFFPPAQMLANLLLPAVAQVENASFRLQRHVAFLATAEAVRMHAAKNGEFPDAIENLSPVPAWLEPTTSEPFEYKRLSPKSAILTRNNLPASSKFAWQLMLQD